MPYETEQTPFQRGLKTIPVSYLVKKIKNFLENKVNMTGILVSGEISNLRPGGNGHLYFNLKDETAAMSCVMWASNLRSLPFVPEDGMSVVVGGSLSVYEKRGTMSIVCHTMQPTGIGMLYAQLEALKNRLSSEGLFNNEHKKPKPEEIRSIGLVTGENTAALQDVMKTIRMRWPMLNVTLFPALVQGDKAPADIVRQLKNADTYGFDAVLLVRGGGSFEDLFCFNDEQIVRTLYGMKTYTVTGIGHEIDTSLADLAADHRALTPTAAAQWVTEDQREICSRIQNAKARMLASVRRIFDSASAHLMMIMSNPYLSNPLSYAESRRQKLEFLNSQLHNRLERTDSDCSHTLESLKTEMINAMNSRISFSERSLLIASSKLESSSPQRQIVLEREELQNLKKQMIRELRNRLESSRNRLNSLTELMQAVSPECILKKGYALIEADHHYVKSVSGLSPDQKIEVILCDGILESRIEKIKETKDEQSGTPGK